MIKKTIYLTFGLLLLAITMYPCTNLLVGKKASVDGSTMISYSADSYTLYGELYHWPARAYAPGTMLKIYEWDTGKYLGEIAQASRTYSVIGNMNEHQLAIAETTYGGREELADSTGIMDYGSLIYVTLQRARDAREAIKVMTDLVKKYGYYSSGESFSIADPNEVWILEMIGKGPGRTGAVWVAVRVPDDCVAAHANHARIQQFPLNDPQNCVYAPDVISFAREKGFFNGKDSEFSFSKAYAPADFGALRYCEARVWSFFNRVNSDMERYVSYAKGETTDPMPLFIKPDRKLSVQDMQAYMRDHYEDTPLDWRYDVGAGPFNSPYRWSPLEWQVDSVTYCNERPIATQQTGFTFVTQSRAGMPNEVGGIIWFGVDDAAQTVYYPIYCANTDVPDEMREGNGDFMTFSWTSAFWIHNWVSNMVYNRYSDMIKDVRAVQGKLENSFKENQARVEEKALALSKKSKSEAVAFLTQYSKDVVRNGVSEWKKLGEYMVVKYMDGAIKKEENGQFKRNKYGKLSAFPNRPGYSKEYYEKVVKQTGDKYKVLF